MYLYRLSFIFLIFFLNNIQANNQENNINSLVDITRTLEASNIPGYIEGKQLFISNNCSFCHGLNFNHHKLSLANRFKIEKPEKELLQNLIGYKLGIYGSNMKGIMNRKVKKISNKDLSFLATYIFYARNKNYK